MNKQEYLSELESHLASISEEERVNALRFYEEYFEDAGPENEQQVISELGKPFALAKSIICEQSAYSKSRSFANYKASVSAKLNETANSEAEPDAMPQQPHTQYTAYNYADSNDGEKYGSYERYKESYGGYNDEEKYPSDDSTYNNERYDNSYKRNGEYSRRSSAGSPNTVGFILFILFVVFVIAPAVIIIACIAFGLIVGAAGCLIAAFVTLILALARSSGFYLGIAVLCAGLAMIFFPIGLVLAVKLLPRIAKWTVQTLKELSGGGI